MGTLFSNLKYLSENNFSGWENHAADLVDCYNGNHKTYDFCRGASRIKKLNVLFSEHNLPIIPAENMNSELELFTKALGIA